jgi:FkbM family methyltransferase
MSFVSYAQNFEDVMLWRALKHVEQGFYIDIGAQDPVIDSVSLAFYENGWRGVHVEPTIQYSNKLRQARPDEIVEQVAIGNGDGPLVFYEFMDTGLSTAHSDIAQKHKQAGFSCIESRVPLLSLDALFERIGERVIHWLKVDVEGMEKDVLESWKESKARPWVLVIESTRPMTQEDTYSEWEDLVLSKSYQFAYYDGVNRFYVHSEQLCLLSAFRVPPNIFDGFMLSGTASHPFYTLLEIKAQPTEVKLLQAEVKVQQAEAKAQQAKAKAQQAEAKAQQAEADLNTVYNSRSWRITVPLRWCGLQARLVRQHGLTLRLKALVKRIVQSLARRGVAFLDARPGLRLRCVALIRRVGIYDPLRSFYFRCSSQQKRRTSASAAGQRAVSHETMDQLTFRARQIYAHLNAAIEHHQTENR